MQKPELVELVKNGLSSAKKLCDIERKSHYRAILNWLTHYEVSVDASSLEKVEGYLQAFAHFCTLEEWRKACAVADMQLNTPTGGRLVYELQSWGAYQQVLSICSQLLSKSPGALDCMLYQEMGQACHNAGMFQKALCYFEKALTLSRELENTLDEGGILGNIGNIYRSMGDLDKGELYLKLCWEILQHSDSTGDKTFYSSSAANIHLDRGEYEKSIQLLQENLSLFEFEEMDESWGYLTSLVNLSAGYNSSGQHGKGAKYARKGLGIACATGNRKLEAKLLANLGNSQDALDDRQNALVSLQSARNIFLEIGDKEGEGEIIIGLLGYKPKKL